MPIITVRSDASHRSRLVEFHDEMLDGDDVLFQIPPGYTGPFVLPSSGRMIWWTGRVAIGLRHQKVLQ